MCLLFLFASLTEKRNENEGIGSFGNLRGGMGFVRGFGGGVYR